MPKHDPWNAEEAAGIVKAMGAMPGAMLPILHALQARFGYIEKAIVPVIADTLNLSRAEVHGTISFYHDFKDHLPGRKVVKLCRAEACQSRGAVALHEAVKRELGVDWHDTTVDGATTIEPVYCLGLCASAPAALVDGVPYGHVTVESLRAATDRLPPAPYAVTAEHAATTVYLPQDAAALAAGADAVAAALIDQAGTPLKLVRTGSRGLFWLEPMVEVATPEGRIAYGPVKPDDIAGLLQAGMLAGGAHPLRLGKPEDIPYLARQTRLTFERCGVVDPLSFGDYRAHGGYVGLDNALAMDAAAITEAVKDSSLRGRGGAGFPTGIKWNTVRLAQADQKYIVCNADEGDSGTFADRLLMEGDPFMLIEGMTIAGLAVDATIGFIYIRSEYPHAFETMTKAIAAATRAGALGPSVFGSGRAFTLEARMGAGAYICGEETSLLESLEGRRGTVRAKPPLPALEGLFGKPTVVNNVLSLATVPWILAHGAKAYADFGMGRSRGTLAIQLGGNIQHGGLVEVAFGMTLREAIEDFGGGTASGRPIRAAQVGGPLGAYWPDSLFDTPLDYEAFAAKQGLVGHGGIVVFDDTVDLAAQARFAFEFCAAESCGKCTPCRIGAVRGVETMDKVIAGTAVEKNLTLVQDLCQTMTDASLCAMGGLTPIPVISAITHFPQDFVPASLRVAAE